MTLINAESNLGGQTYPMLDGTDWRVESETVVSDEDWLADILTKTPALRFCKGGKVTDVYCDGLSSDEFLKTQGLTVTVNKGPFVTSKRLSRIFRPGFLSNRYNDLSVRYDAALDATLWDGAGLVNRVLLLSMIPTLGRLSERKRKQLVHELHTLKRVEFTVQSERGQDKGHAFVVEDLDCDFVLPCDTKSEVKLAGDALVVLNPIHSSDSMNLDVQSHINLHPFFSTENLKFWLKAEGDLFLKALRTGEMTEALGRVDSTEELSDWWVRDYFAFGGKVEWFAGIVRAVAAQHANKISKTNYGKFKLPIPGGRYYLFADVVGGRTVASGEIELDPESATAYISAQDYVEIAGILGGADQDDALWIFPFTDHDGERKIMAWRSPNQIGEYVLLKPSANSHEIVWATGDEPIVWPEMDSALLPPRIDQIRTTYANLVRKVNTAPGPYSITAMNIGIQQMISNGAVLGMLCNLLMVAKGVYGKGPKSMPAKLEEVIDADVKTGDDLEQVRTWIMDKARVLVKDQNHIPHALWKRISGLCGETLAETLVATTDHWLDDVMAMVASHRHGYQAQVEQIANACTPPAIVQAHSEGQMKLANELRMQYVEMMSLLGETNAFMGDDEMRQIRGLVEGFLDNHDREKQRYILMSILNGIYFSHRSKGRVSDTICWLMGEQEPGEIRLPGIADRMLEALRYFGILETVVDLPEGGVMSYTRRPPAIPLTIKGVWFSQAKAKANYAVQSDVPKAERDAIKARVALDAQAGRYNGRTFHIQAIDDRKVLVDSDGTIFGYVAKTQEYRVGATATITAATAHDGNLNAMIQ